MTSSSGLEQEASDRWQVVASRSKYWRSWDGEIVVYDDLSGDTLKLDPVMAEAFRQLLLGQPSLSELCDHIAATFDLEPDYKLRRWLEIAMDKFRRSGLIEPEGQ